MNFFLLFLLAFFTYVYIWLKKRKNYWKDRGFVYEKLELPFGSFKGIGSEKSMCIGLDEYYKKYKGKGMAVGLFCFVKPLLLPIDPELIKIICVQNFDAFQDRLIYYNKEDDPISVHLLALEGQEWKERRVKLTPTFTSGKMKLMFDIVQLIGNHFVDSLENAIKSSNELEMHDWLARFTTDVISNVAFGMDSNSLDNPQSDMRKYGKKILDLGASGFLKFLFTSSFPELSRKMHITANKRNVIDFFYKTFKQNIEQRERSETFRKDFIQILLELKKSSSLTVSELAAESFIFFLGGFETSSSLMCFTIYELALNPEIQDRLREEIINGIAENDGELTYELLSEFKYLDMVINETLRKFPPAFFLTRVCRKNFKIPGTEMVIPKDTDINVNIYSIHHDPEYYPDPEKFDPERFTAENIKKRPACTFIPFGLGPRRCIVSGRFGLLQSKMGITKLIQNFEFTPCERTSIPVEFSPSGIFLEPRKKMWLNVKKYE